MRQLPIILRTMRMILELTEIETTARANEMKCLGPLGYVRRNFPLYRHNFCNSNFMVETSDLKHAEKWQVNQSGNDVRKRG